MAIERGKFQSFEFNGVQPVITPHARGCDDETCVQLRVFASRNDYERLRSTVEAHDAKAGLVTPDPWPARKKGR